MIEFKVAKKSDVTILSLLGRITYKESHGHFIDDKKDLSVFLDNAFSVEKTTHDLDNENIFFFIMYLNNLPVGYSKIITNNSFEDKNEKTSCRLERIYILNDFIPKKLGYKFLKFIEQTSKELNATSLWLSVYIKNEKAIQFYKRNEFIDLGKMNYLVNGKEYDNYVLSKKI